MNNESLAFKIFSAAKVPALPVDTVLGIKDNSNHPRFTPTRHENYEVAHSNLLTAQIALQDAYTELAKQPDIDLKELKLAFALTGSYLFIVQEAMHVNVHRAPRPKNGLVGLAA